MVYIKIVIAISAFGTGVVSPHIRVVLHIRSYRSLSECSKNGRRAGRNADETRCIIVYNERFARLFTGHIATGVPDSVPKNLFLY